MTSIIILGGVGFIGRNLVCYLVENKLCSEIRVVDKVLPATAYLTKSHAASFTKVEFKQANLLNTMALEKAFEKSDGKPFDFAVNLAGETKYSQTEEAKIYYEKVYQLSLTCAKMAAQKKVGLYVEVSTAQVYDSGKKPSKETSTLKPWTLLAKHKLKAENEICLIPGLKWIILRPAIVYGPGDLSGLTPRLVIGAVYKELKEELKVLWTKDLRMNTVHVQDLVSAIWHVLEHGVPGEIYNLADKGDTDQEAVNRIVQSIFRIDVGYQGTLISNFARLNLSSVTEDVNEKHLQPWSEICIRSRIANTPLSPYLDQELLYNNSLSVDGSKIEQLGFTYSHPRITEELVRQVLNEFVELKLFPSGFF